MKTIFKQMVNRNHFLVVVMLFLTFNLVGVTAAGAQTTTTPTPIPLDNTANTAVSTMVSVTTAIENFLIRLTQFPQNNVARLIMIVAGVLLLVAGWRVYEFIIIIAGAIVGAEVALSLVVSDVVLVNLLALVMGAIVGGFLSMFLYYVAVFLIGAHLGILLTSGLAAALGIHSVPGLILLLGGIIGGLVLLGLSFEFLIVISALVGAQMLTSALGLNAFWMLILAIMGILIQYSLTRVYHYDFRRHSVYRRRTYVNS
jgi:hypothetical protein